MKKHLYILACLAIGMSACGPVYVVHQDPPPPHPAPPPVEVAPAPPAYSPEPETDISYQNFYDDLAPYGQWIDDPNYGYVWMPAVGADFRPYATNGQWVYTEDGWTWASNYPWGWAAFHYGRWFFQDGYGWMWVPGNEWAPAWVSWRSSNDYYGWAPLAPNVSYYGSYNPPPHYWCFVPRQYVNSPYANRYYVNESRNVTIINNTTIINNVTVINNRTVRNVNYGRGPDANEVGRFSGTPVRTVNIVRNSRPGERYDNNSYSVYRPRITSGPVSQDNINNRPAPRQVQPIRNVRPVNTNVYNNNGRPGGWDNRGNDNRGNGSGSAPGANNGNSGPRNVNGGWNNSNNSPQQGGNSGWNRNPQNQQPSNGGQPANGNQPSNGTPSNQNPIGNRPGSGNTGWPNRNNPQQYGQVNERPVTNVPANPQGNPQGNPSAGGQVTGSVQPGGRPVSSAPAQNPSPQNPPVNPPAGGQVTGNPSSNRPSETRESRPGGIFSRPPQQQQPQQPAPQQQPSRPPVTQQPTQQPQSNRPGVFRPAQPSPQQPQAKPAEQPRPQPQVARPAPRPAPAPPKDDKKPNN